MRNPEGESDHGPLRPHFDRRLKLEFHGSRVTSDAGLLAYRELDDALGLTALAGGVLADSRTGRNGWHGIVSLLRQSVYGRLAGYEDVNDADRLGRDPAMRWIVGGKAVERGGASTSQMGRFEIELLANNENLADLSYAGNTSRTIASKRRLQWRCGFTCYLPQQGPRQPAAAAARDRDPPARLAPPRGRAWPGAGRRMDVREDVPAACNHPSQGRRHYADSHGPLLTAAMILASHHLSKQTLCSLADRWKRA